VLHALPISSPIITQFMSVYTELSKQFSQQHSNSWKAKMLNLQMFLSVLSTVPV
jgi:hypothetical protein